MRRWPILLFLVFGGASLASDTRPKEEARAEFGDDMNSKIFLKALIYTSAISHPDPEYPLEAVQRHMTGRGIVEAKVSRGGEVYSVTMLKSTGRSVLDNAARSALWHWRFQPKNPPLHFEIPVIFSISTKPPKDLTKR